MPDYSSFKPTSDGDGRDYVTKWPALVDQVGEDLDGKAPANHDHDGGSGATIAIGGTSARPAVCDGFVFSNTDTGRIEILAADGSVLLDIVPMPGFIAGMQISRSNTNQLTVQPGFMVSGSKLYVLPSAVAVTVGSVASLAWRGLNAVLPSSGNILAASNFADIAISDVVKSSDGTYWHRNGYTDRRVIGLYPVVSSDVLSGFETTSGGKYKLANYYQVVNDSTPPTTATSTDIGLPALTGAVGQVLVRSAAGTSATRLGITMDGIKIADAPGRYVTGWAEAYSDDGTVDLSIACTGDTATLLDVRLVSVDIPVGMAR